jgi:hypothetical protein
MLKLFGRFSPQSVLFLYILNWLLKLKYILYPQVELNAFNISEVGVFNFPSIANWAISHPIFYTFLSMHLLFGIAILVNHLWRIEKIIPKSSMLPALSIVICSSLLPSGFLMSMNSIIFVLLIAALMLVFSANIQAGANARLFRAGAIMGCVVMMKPVMIIIALSIIIVIAIFKSIDGRSVIAYLLGCIIPTYLFISTVWLLSPNLLSKITKIHFEIPSQVNDKIAELILSVIVLIWFIVHAYFIKQNKSEIGGIQVQKKWLSLRVLWVAILITVVFSKEIPSFSFFLMINLSALLLFQCFNMVLNKKWANFTFVFLILVTLINEYVLM